MFAKPFYNLATMGGKTMGGKTMGGKTMGGKLAEPIGPILRFASSAEVPPALRSESSNEEPPRCDFR